MERLKIGHHIYEVTYHDILRTDEGQELFGEILYNEKEIRISTKYKNDSLRANILIHEAVHGLFNESALENEADNEDLVERFSNTLHGFLQDNIDELIKLYKSE